MAESTRAGKGVGPVLAAAHLADSQMPALSELEFALTVAGNAFERWKVRCMAAAGVPGLQSIEVQLLHTVANRRHDKTQADLCMMYNIEDTHVVAYALKKLESLGLIETGRRGKEKTVRITASGTAACSRYGEIREALLVDSIQSLNFDNEKMSALAAMLRALSGQYDQAARGAAIL